jgi:transposase
VLSYFTHRLTNAASESINAVVRGLPKRAFGYRSFSNFRIAVLFRCANVSSMSRYKRWFTTFR